MMRGNKKHLWVGLVIVLVVGLIFLIRGQRDPIPEAPADDELPLHLTHDFVAERGRDPVYVAALMGVIEERRETIAASHAVRWQMEQILEAERQNVDLDDAMEAADADTVSEDDVISQGPLEPGAIFYAPDVPPAADLSGIHPLLLEHVRQLAEWRALEARLNALASQQQEIQIRTRTLIRERMIAQYEAWSGQRTEPDMQPPPEVVQTMPYPATFDDEPIIITNVPPEGINIPPVPDRQPVNIFE